MIVAPSTLALMVRGLRQDLAQRPMKRRQHIEKRLERKASQHLEHEGLGGNPFERQHLDPPLLLDQDRHHTIAALFPIKSIRSANLPEA